jgi:hypothetical protein
LFVLNRWDISQDTFALMTSIIMSDAAVEAQGDLCQKKSTPVYKQQVSDLSTAATDAPGIGWSNGAFVPKSVVFPYDREGKVKMYHDERR